MDDRKLSQRLLEMVCSTCGLIGHNKRTCKQPMKEHKPSVVSHITEMMDNTTKLRSKANKIKQVIIIFDYLVFHKWFVLKHGRFQRVVLDKLKQLEGDVPNTDYYRKQFTKKVNKVKKIKTDDCPICYNKLEDINVCTTKCGHSFCMGCMLRCIRMDNNTCPICRDKL